MVSVLRLYIEINPLLLGGLVGLRRLFDWRLYNPGNLLSENRDHGQMSYLFTFDCKWSLVTPGVSDNKLPREQNKLGVADIPHKLISI